MKHSVGAVAVVGATVFVAIACSDSGSAGPPAAGSSSASSTSSSGSSTSSSGATSSSGGSSGTSSGGNAADGVKIAAATGGALTSADGILKLDIPAGALAADTTISIKVVPKTEWPANVAALEPVSDVYAIEPEGTIFSKAVIATWTYATAPAGVRSADATSLLFGTARSASGEISHHPGTTTVPGANNALTVYSSLRHLNHHWLTSSISGFGTSIIKVGEALSAVPPTEPNGFPFTSSAGVRPLATLPPATVQFTTWTDAPLSTTSKSGGWQPTSLNLPGLPPGRPALYSSKKNVDLVGGSTYFASPAPGWECANVGAAVAHTEVRVTFNLDTELPSDPLLTGLPSTSLAFAASVELADPVSCVADPGCVPLGTATGAPTGSLSDTAACAGAEVFWGGSNLGTRSCWTLGTKTFSSVSGSASRAVIPADAPAGANQTLTVAGPGGTATSQITITPGEAAIMTSLTPPSAAAGTEVTVTGTGLTGITKVDVGSNAPGNPVLQGTVTSNTGTQLKFNMPSGLTPGASHVGILKLNCSSSQLSITAL